jgi:hypothetical protein
MDLLYIVLAVLFFASSWALIELCDKLSGDAH